MAHAALHVLEEDGVTDPGRLFEVGHQTGLDFLAALDIILLVTSLGDGLAFAILIT